MHNSSSTSGDRLPRKPRELTTFLCREMLYDYLTKNLDEDRRAAVERFLATSPELQSELQLLGLAERYCQDLSKTRVTSAHIEELKTIKSATAVVVNRLRWVNWPETLRWATQALVVSSMVALLAVVIPWNKINLRFPKRVNAPISQNIPAPVPVPVESAAPAPVAPVPAAAPAAAPVAASAPAPAPVETTAIVASTPPSELTESDKTLAKNTEEEEEAETDKGAPKTVQLHGMLFRMMMNINNAEGLTPEITEKILKMGGEKAGQVKLGWRKNHPNGSYYHFKMPEENYSELVKTLGAYGPVRIYKSPHGRVMPPGQIRIILFVQDK
jgi:hypothetical protein